MSGPKTSHYTLTPEQRRIIEERRRLEEEKTRVRAGISALSGLANELSECRQKSEISARFAGFAAETQKLLEAVEAAIVSAPAGITDSATLKTARIFFDGRIQELQKAAEPFVRGVVEVENAVKAEIREGLSKGLFFSIPEDRPDTLAQKKEVMRQRLRNLQQGRALSAPLRAEITNALVNLSEIFDIDFMRNFERLTIAVLEQKCKDYAAAHQKAEAEFIELRARYNAICQAAGILPLMKEFSAANAEFLQKQITALESELDSRAEKEYISACMDEVMEEMGYELLGGRSFTKKNGKQFVGKLYAFEEGTAVNVTYASDGKITMELGGLDFTDRLPTDGEKVRLAEDMENFCGDFAEIERRLKQKGIVTGRRIALLPPDADYAQIINAGDYELKHQITAIADGGKRRQKSDAPKAKRLNHGE